MNKQEPLEVPIFGSVSRVICGCCGDSTYFWNGAPYLTAHGFHATRFIDASLRYLPEAVHFANDLFLNGTDDRALREATARFVERSGTVLLNQDVWKIMESLTG